VSAVVSKYMTAATTSTQNRLVSQSVSESFVNFEINECQVCAIGVMEL